MRDILLSICIPTYNRGELLKQAVLSIMVQVTDRNKDELEICISDNASSDNTNRIVKELENSCLCRIVYNKNVKNIGAEKNFKKVISMASGRYVTIMGSDDVYNENILDEVFEKIKDGYNLIFFNIKTFYNNDLGDCSLADSIGTYDQLALSGKESIFKFFGTEINYISSLFIDKEYYDYDKTNSSTLECLHDYGFSYMYCFLSLMPDDCKGIFIGNSYIMHRDGRYDVWYNYRKYFFIGMGKVLKSLKGIYKKKTLSVVKKKHLKRYIGLSSLDLKTFLIGIPYYGNILYYYFYIIHIFVPKFIWENTIIKHQLRKLL